MVSKVHDIKLLEKGERGLFYSDGNRIYFPDWRWKDAKVGLFTDMKITKDKDSYAFITGKMVDPDFILGNAVDILDNLFLITVGEYFRKGHKVKVYEDNTFSIISQLGKSEYEGDRNIILDTNEGYRVFKIDSISSDVSSKISKKVVKVADFSDLSKSVIDSKSCGTYIFGRKHGGECREILEVEVSLAKKKYTVKMFNAGHDNYEENLKNTELVEKVRDSWEEFEQVKRDFCKCGGQQVIKEVAKATVPNTIFSCFV